MKKPQQTVHFFKSTKETFIIVSDTTRPIGIKIDVSGKKEARKKAKELGATPWNF